MKFAGHEPIGAIFFLVLLVGLCLNSTSALSQQQSKEKRSKKMDEKMALAQKTLEANESKLRKIPGVVGVGLGWSEKGDVPAIHVYVDVESTGGTVPAAIPKRIDKVPVRIMKTDQIKAR